MRDTASLVAEQPEPIRKLFDLGKTEHAVARTFDDYAALGLTAEHAPALAAVLRDPRFGPSDPVGLEFTEEEHRWAWADVHVPRALVSLGGSDAAPALLDLAARVTEEHDFGDVVTEELEGWLVRLGREGVEHCLSIIGRPGSAWLVESAALDNVNHWLEENPGPDADAMKARAIDQLTSALAEAERSDDGTNGHRVWYLAKWRATDALPAIDAAFDRGLIDTHASGSRENVHRTFRGEPPVHKPHPMFEEMVKNLAAQAEDKRATERWAKSVKKKKRKKRR